MDELDSIRGLAAMSVLFGHFTGLWLDDTMRASSHHARQLFTYLTYPFSAGHEAVVLFFILSGFVLSIPAINARAQAYRVFAIRRIFRIYIPYLAALGIAILGSAFFHRSVTHCELFNSSWSGPVDQHLIIQHLTFIGDYPTIQFDPPIWSLIHEMRISLVFPILCALALRLTPRNSLIAAFGMSLLSGIPNLFLLSLRGTNSITNSFHYAALFVVGIYVARKRTALTDAFNKVSKYARGAIALLSILLYVYGGYVLKELLAKVSTHSFHLSDWITALGAACLIVVSLSSSSIHRVLLWFPIRTLGTMSYSVYLLHYIVMLLLVHLLYGKLPLLVIFSFCIVVVLAVSRAFFLFVETPAIAMGRRLSQTQIEKSEVALIP
ncbi:MAG: acyltransferase [Candidatus Pacebacteria bacterium]|nr:acyltransferase [Candidatus Paceibacterota bacterium]